MTDFVHLFRAESWSQALDPLLKLGYAGLLGFVVGWEREMHGRPAGVRTHMLVAIGSALFSLVGTAFGGDQGRVAAQVVTGIGFLGAGTIMRMGGEVKGLTTAASIWAIAAVGMAVAVGGPYLIVAGAATGLSLITLALIDNLERRFIRPPQERLALAVVLTHRGALAEVLQELEAVETTVRAVHVLSTDPDLEVRLDLEKRDEALLRRLTAIPAVKSAAWN